MLISGNIIAVHPNNSDMLIFGSAPWWQIITCFGMAALGIGSTVMSIKFFRISSRLNKQAMEEASSMYQEGMDSWDVELEELEELGDSNYIP